MAAQSDKGPMEILGTTDEVTTCECCGRADLRRTVCLSDGRHLGTECAARALSTTAAHVRNFALRVDHMTRALDAARRARAIEVEYLAWISFLTSRTGTIDVIRAIEMMGGISAAHAAFEGSR